MVLHGYKRPGHGWIEGSCPASSRYEPYEISCEGTKAMLRLAQGALAYAQERLEKVKTATQLTEKKFSPPSEYHNAWLTKAEKDQIKRSGKYDVIRTYFPTDPEWGSKLKARIWNATQQISQVEDDIKFLTGKIESWKPVELKAINAARDAEAAAKAAGNCPGSGTYEHDSSRMRFAYYKGGICKHCKKFVTCSSTGKMRAHPKAEG